MAAARQGYGPLVGSVSHVDHESPEALEDEIAARRRGERRRVLLRAGDRRGRRPPRAARLHRSGRGDLRAPRRAARDRQRDLRVRPHRHLVRLRALGHRAGHGRARQGHHERLPAARRGAGQRHRRRAVLGGPGGPMFRHGATYAGHPTCCVAALANIDILEREDLVAARPRARGRADGRPRAARRSPRRGEIRGGLGLAAAVELDARCCSRADPAALGALLERGPRGGRAAARRRRRASRSGRR